MRLRFVGLILLLGCLAGCSTTTRMHTRVYEPETAYPPTNPHQIKILMAFPEQEHIEIGEIELEDDAFVQKDYDPQVITGFEKMLKMEVARMGGDAFIVLEDKPIGQMNRTSGYTEGYTDTTGNVFSGTEHITEWEDFGRKVAGIVIKRGGPPLPAET